MLLIPRRIGESVRIGDDIVVTPVEIRGDKVRLVVTLPGGMPVRRQEDWVAVHGPGSQAILDPAWLTWNDGTVPRLARSIADKGSYDTLPILADALEEAGCADADILGHCRSSGRHTRSSWVVDLILSVS